jgi:hypothetical protein
LKVFHGGLRTNLFCYFFFNLKRKVLIIGHKKPYPESGFTKKPEPESRFNEFGTVTAATLHPITVKIRVSDPDPYPDPDPH